MSVESSLNQQVADAVGLTIDRQLASGAPWCPPQDAGAVRRWIVDRGPELGTNIRRVVRLARLMHLADGKDYARFLYVRLSALRAREFKTAFQSAQRTGMLPASLVKSTDSGVVLLEPDGQTFEINFAQMPRLAALLDIVHNCLGFQTVRKLLEPAWLGSDRSAAEISRQLQAILSGWLNERLESLTHCRQAQRMWSFLNANGPVSVSAITDETILSFWSAVGSTPATETVDGFRLFTSAARAMLRYRDALGEADRQHQIERSLAGGREADVRALELATEEDFETIDSYRSPLATLTTQAGDRIKWLTQRELDLLQHAMGMAAGRQTSESDEAEASDRALMPGRAFDVAFAATLRRADVFGAAQASLVARVRKKISGKDAIAQISSELADDSYESLALSYEDIRAQLRLEGLAAAAILMEAGRAEAAFLLREVADPNVLTSLLANVRRRADDNDEDETDDAEIGNVARALKSALAQPELYPAPVKDFLGDARAAMRRVNRSGFRKEDRETTATIDAIAITAPAAMAIARELEKLVPALRSRSTEALAADRPIFLEGYERLYAANGLAAGRY